MKEKLGQEPIHPTPHYNKESGHMNGFSDGINKRFYAACAAMQGLISNFPESRKVNDGFIAITDQKVIIAEAYQFADELLKQENE